MDEAYITRQIRYSKGRRVAVLDVNWEKLAQAGIYEREKMKK